MAAPDMRQHVEVSDDDRTVATAEVTTSEGSGGTARVSLRAEPGHIAPGRRARLVDAVLDLPEVREGSRLEAALRTGRRPWPVTGPGRAGSCRRPSASPTWSRSAPPPAGWPGRSRVYQPELAEKTSIHHD